MSRHSHCSTIKPSQLTAWNFLGEFRRRLAKVSPSPAASFFEHKGGPKRLLTEDDYLCAFLFAQFNPVIDSMRGLCACSDFALVQEQVCGRHISLGSFSEAQSVFGSGRLHKLFAKMLREDPDAIVPPCGCCPGQRLRLIDSSVFKAVPRMDWAEWRHQKTTQRAVRLHLKFNLLRGEPDEASITPGRVCERKAFGKMLRSGEFYVGDRNYGRDYRLLQKLTDKDCGYVIRLCENANIRTLEDLPLDEADRAAGVVSDQLVCMGSRKRWQHETVRVIRIEKPGLEVPVILVTNRTETKSHSAELLATIYRERWKIELFFRWFKCVLGRADQWHWFAESAEGVAIQIYSALIAALLLARHTGKLPAKRQMEAIRFCAMGMASADEMEKILAKETGKKRN